MDEQQLDQTVERVKAAGEVIATPDPAIRSQAFAVLIGQTASGVSGHGGESGLGPLAAGADIAELAFVVLMDAAQDANRDLQGIMAEVKAMTNAKQALRDLISKVGRD